MAEDYALKPRYVNLILFCFLFVLLFIKLNFEFLVSLLWILDLSSSWDTLREGSWNLAWANSSDN